MNVVKLNINYRDLQYTLVEESQKTTWLDLISNIGGTLGLFTGFSFLSLGDVAVSLAKFKTFCVRSSLIA